MAQFAGSRHLDERRRRRLAGELDDSTPTGEAAEKKARKPKPESEEDQPLPSRGPNRGRRLPLRRIVSPRLWKHGLTAVAVFAAAGGVLAAGWKSEGVAARLGPSAGAFVAFAGGKLVSAFAGALLLASAALAQLIWFIRSRSRQDFAGRYRIWGWGAVVGYFAAATVLTDLHLVWSRTLTFVLNVELPHAETWLWLAPLLGCTTVMLRDLLVDMRRCRSSRALLWAAILCWTSGLVQNLGYGLDWADRTNEAAVGAAALFGHCFLFASLLLHARFVLFVTSEPPATRESWWTRLNRRVAGRLQAALRRRRDRSAERSQQRRKLAEERKASRRAARLEAKQQRREERESAREAAAREKADRKSASKAAEGPSAEKQTGKSKKAAATGDAPVRSDDAQPAAAKPQPERPSPEGVRIDARHDSPAGPKGLSKRERRQMRKQQRTQNAND